MITIAISQGYQLILGKSDLNNNAHTVEISIIFLAIYSMIFLIELFTIVYFIRMASNFIVLLNEFYKLNIKMVKTIIYIIAAWVIITNARMEVYVPTISIFSFILDEKELMNRPYFDILNQILIYMSKFTPTILTCVISVITAFLAEDNSTPIDASYHD